jgi:selenocysteine lyase/cysteine desulfurase
MASRLLSPARFRQLFPALQSLVWLDTPGAPPGAEPVVQAVHDAISAWSSGEFDRHAWDAATGQARGLFARLIGVDPATVSTLGSLAEAAATVAGSLPPGRIVVAAEEFRSNLLPWLARPEHQVVMVPAHDGITRVEDLIEALDEGTVLLAVSEVTSREGQRPTSSSCAPTTPTGFRLGCAGSGSGRPRSATGSASASTTTTTTTTCRPHFAHSKARS